MVPGTPRAGWRRPGNTWLGGSELSPGLNPVSPPTPSPEESWSGGEVTSSLSFKFAFSKVSRTQQNQTQSCRKSWSWPRRQSPSLSRMADAKPRWEEVLSGGFSVFSFPRLYGEDLQDSLCGVTNILTHTGDIFRKNVKCAHPLLRPWNRINKGYITPCTGESIPSFHHDNMSWAEQGCEWRASQGQGHSCLLWLLSLPPKTCNS